MQRLLGCLAAAVVSAAVPAAYADHTGYAGGCSVAAINDTTPGGMLGGRSQWHGEIDVVVVATDAAGTPQPHAIRAECELVVNGQSQGTVATATRPGIGVAAGGGWFSFTAGATDVVTVCSHVWVGTEHHVDCGGHTPRPIVLQPVIDLVDEAIIVLIESVERIVQLFDDVGPGPDALVCDMFQLVAGGVVPGVVDVNDQGDVFLLGEPFWDCPPYDLFPPDGG